MSNFSERLAALLGKGLKYSTGRGIVREGESSSFRCWSEYGKRNSSLSPRAATPSALFADTSRLEGLEKVSAGGLFAVEEQEEGGKLDKFKEPYRKESDDRKRDEEKEGRRDSDKRNLFKSEAKGSWDWVGDILMFAFVGGNAHYRGYPYRGGGERGAIGAKEGQEFALTLHSAYQRIDADTWSYDIGGKMRLPSSFAIDISNTRYDEDLGGGRNDRMGFFESHFSYGISVEELQIDIGIGVAALDKGDGGLSFQGSLDYFPAKPLGFHVSASWASINGEDIADYRGEIGLLFGRLEVLAGYRSLINSGGDALAGPTLGLSLWF